MSAFAMIAGKLAGEPKTRDTKSGGKVTFFRMRVANGATREFWDVATFADDCRAELDGLPEGFPLCATGEFSVEPWERDGKRGFNLRMTANTVTRLSGKKRAPRAAHAEADRPRDRQPVMGRARQHERGAG